MSSLLQQIKSLDINKQNKLTSADTLSLDTLTSIDVDVLGNATVGGDLLVKGIELDAKITNATSGKQDTLTPGTNITIDANNIISAAGGTDGGITQEQLDAKEDLITTSTDISSNTLTTVGDLNVGGKIIAPNRVNFRARRSSNLTVSAPATINYDDVRFNLGGSSYSQFTRGIFTARTAGKYFFFANFFTIPDVEFVVDIYHFNSSRNRVSAGRQQGITTTQEARYITATIDLEDGWDVRVRVALGSVFVGDGTSNGSADRDYTSFGGFLIG